MTNKKMYRMYAFNNADIEGKIIKVTTNQLKEKEIRLSESSLIHAYCRYTNTEFVNDMLITDIIKVTLSKDFETALKQCKFLTLKNKKYKAWFATPNGMKKEDKDTKSKCEMFFVSTEILNFRDFFEELISLDKIQGYYDTKRVINKDLARISLSTSASIRTNLVPKIIILPECSYTITSDIVTVIGNKVISITKDSDEELQGHRNIGVTPFDGCGLMSLNFAKKLQQELAINYPISFAMIRMYNGLAIKGLVTAIDYVSYFSEFYKEDSEYFKKVDNKFYIKDVFGEFKCVNEADMILNATQTKWVDNFNSMNEIYELLNKEKFKDYKDLIECLYITKINKPDDDIKEYSLSNYQLLSNLTLTEKEMQELSSKTEELYKEILNGNEDLTRVYWGDIIKLNYINEGEDKISIRPCASTKAQEILCTNPDFIKSGFVKRTVGRIIKKKIYELAAGKFYIKGDCKTLVQDPITFMDWIINRTDNTLEIKINGLDANTFYCSDINKNETRTISRNPLNSFSEILNITFNRNKILDKYLGHLSKETIIFNCYDLTPQVLSGCDFDGDIALVVNDNIIKNSVVEDLPFINIQDGKSEKMIFNDLNRREATLKASGNLIGRLANYGAGVTNLATKADYRAYEAKNSGDIYNFEFLQTKYFELNSDKEYEDFLKELEEKFNYLEDYYTENELKEQIKDGLFAYREESYRLRNLQMQAIDAPKTLFVPEIPKDFKGFKKPRYLYYAKKHITKKSTKYVDNALNMNARRIASQLLKEDIELVNSSDNKALIKKYLLVDSDTTSTFNKQEYNKCKLEIEGLYNKYTDKTSIYSKEDIKNATDEEVAEILRKEREKRILEHENEIIGMADTIINDYPNVMVSHILAMLECSEKFIFDFFFKAVFKVIENKSANINKISYVEDKNGDIEYLFEKYKKINVSANTDVNIEELHNKKRIKNEEKLIKFNDSFLCEIRVMKLCDHEFKKGEKLKVATQLYKNGVQAVLKNKENEKVCFIFEETSQIDDFRNLIDFEKKKVKIDEVIKESDKTATLLISR